MKTMRAVVDWLKSDEGGRHQPPTGESVTPYSAVVRFAGEPWPTGAAWSLVVKKIQANAPNSWVAAVHFLVPDAPQEMLSEGRTFDLYEGKKRVARGTIEQPVANAS
ncbi:MAG TPA: hypothetical protein VIK18_23525 [Pirellulales bacterium]